MLICAPKPAASIAASLTMLPSMVMVVATVVTLLLPTASMVPA